MIIKVGKFGESQVCTFVDLDGDRFPMSKRVFEQKWKPVETVEDKNARGKA